MTQIQSEVEEHEFSQRETAQVPLVVATLVGATKLTRANSEQLAPLQVAMLAMLDFYRRWLSPAIHSLKPGGCRYVPTCSEYASTAIAIHGPLRGVLLASWRLLRCNPFARGGLDQVPPAPISHHLHNEPLP
jgi:putative membrane protein insertion efficiency factor